MSERARRLSNYWQERKRRWVFSINIGARESPTIFGEGRGARERDRRCSSGVAVGKIASSLKEQAPRNYENDAIRCSLDFYKRSLCGGAKIQKASLLFRINARGSWSCRARVPRWALRFLRSGRRVISCSEPVSAYRCATLLNQI